MTFQHKTRYLFHDFETGGLDPDCSVLTYYGAITDEKFNILRDIELKFRPRNGKYVVSAEAMAINKIDLVDLWKQADDETLCIEKFWQFVREEDWNGVPIIYTAGHNVSFDNAILKKLIGSDLFGQHFERHVFDTGTLAVLFRHMGKLPNWFDISLVNLAEHFKIDPAGAHQSKADVHMTIKVMKCLIEELNQK